MKIPHLKPLARQRGIVAVMAVIFLIAAVIFVLTQTLNMAGTTSVDNSQQLNSTQAFFLAESGLERALTTLRTAALDNTYTDATCTGIIGQRFDLGGGSFTYTNAVSYDQNGNPGGACNGANCTQCVVTVKGSIGATSSRTIQGQLIATQQNGTTGQTNTLCPTGNSLAAINCSPNVVMNMTVKNPNSFAFVHLLFNATTNWGGAPVTPTCQDTGSGSLTACTLAWNIPGNYYNNPASIGVYAPITSAGTFSLTEQVLTNYPLPTGTTSPYNYAAVGAIFSSVGSAAASYVGSFAKTPTLDTQSPPHVLSSSCNITSQMTNPRTQPLPATDCKYSDYQHAYLDTGWTCNANSGNSPNWSNAGTADTLLVGFGGKPYYPGKNSAYPNGCSPIDGVDYYLSATQRCSNQLNGLAVNGQPLYRQLSLDGQQGDYMYSQLWWTYNPAYYETNPTATSAAGASFTGAIGATFTGSITAASFTGAVGAQFTGSISGTTLTVSNISGQLNLNDTITGTSVSGGTTIKQNNSTVSSLTGTGGTGTYTVSVNHSVNSTTMTAASNTLVVSAISSGQLNLNDAITSTGSGTNIRTSPATTITAFGTGTGGTGSYTVSGAQQTVSSRTMTGPATTTITLTGATTAPAVGTALAVASGTGQFLPDSVTGSISGTTLNVTVASGTHLSVGDALFGNGVKPNTTITAPGSGSGGTGTYTITPSQTVASGTIMARAAVVSVASANSFTVSRLPSTPLSGAQLCGGVCPILMSDGVHTTGQVDLSNIVNFDDWSGGFACVKGIDPANIKTVVNVMSKQGQWTEPVQ